MAQRNDNAVAGALTAKAPDDANAKGILISRV